MQDFVRINSNDNVAVALRELATGTVITVAEQEIRLANDIPRGHKLALCNIKKGEAVIKYGFSIGNAKEDILAGQHVHVHNLKTALGDDLSYEYKPSGLNAEASVEARKMPNTEGNVAAREFVVENDVRLKNFLGYQRKNGRVGVRNELWVVPTVGCVNSVAKSIAAKCQHLAGDNIEAVVSYSHPYGCSQMGDDQENTREALADLINHPNAGGVLVLGLGCENSNIEVLKGYLGDYDRERIRFLQAQDVEDEIVQGVEILGELAELASQDVRTEIPVDALVIGLKCGGSDGLSGITANPVVGRFSDYLTQLGGSTILTEVPEMFGAETMLMDRCESYEVFEKTVDLIKDFKDYFRFHNQTIYENPSPGNKDGGISTLEDKALGCTQKSGLSPVRDVLKYAEPIKKKGLNLLSAPGNDLVASTALALSGAQIVLFTTGRGTPFATAVPTVKISTNTPLSNKKSGWIDFDCGRLLEEGMSIDMLACELYDYVIEVASGAFVKSEEDGFRDLAIFKQGVTL